MSMNYPPASPVPGSSPATPSPVTWQVTSQAQVIQPDSTGRLVSGHRVTFTTSNGYAGSVFVSDADYSVDNVKAAIEARLALILGVGGLNGSSSTIRSG